MGKRKKRSKKLFLLNNEIIAKTYQNARENAKYFCRMQSLIVYALRHFSP
jgi:hypothetical protein